MPTLSPDPVSSPDVDISTVLADGLVRSVFQPIRDLDTLQVVGYEALSRGPAGTNLESPDVLFAAARAAGRLEELDWQCQHRALATALIGGLRAPLTLLVNMEPEVVSTTPPEANVSMIAAAAEHLHVVVEFTERSLLLDPARLLNVAALVRDLGWGIALDDVGAHPASLALIPLLQPDVIKLDLALVQTQEPNSTAAIIAAVGAEAERSGATILAEGIETEAHRRVALSMGARLGQGWMLGRPADLPESRDRAVQATSLTGAPIESHRSPFELASETRVIRTSTKPMVLAMSHHLEDQALSFGESGIIVSTLQDIRHLTPRTVVRYRRLAERLTFTALLGAGIGLEPVPGVRGGDLAGTPLAEEWDVAVLTNHFAAALVARDLGDGGPDPERRFEYLVTYDRDLVVRVLRALLHHVPAQTVA